MSESASRGRKHSQDQRQFDRLRPKIEQWAKDYWRPYHGGTGLQDGDGVMLVENRSLVGGHYPLNQAIEKSWESGKLQDSRRLFGRVLAELGLHDRAAFAEILDLFGRYGVGDSDLDNLRRKAEEFGEDSDSAAKLMAVDRGIDAMTEALISWGVTDKDFWADFGLNSVPTQRKTTTEEHYRKHYLHFSALCEELAKERTRYRNKALEGTAQHFGVAKSTIQKAVEQHESGYLRTETS